MSTQSPRRDIGHRAPGPVHPLTAPPEAPSGRVVRYTAAALRLSLGWVFLWAFLDKAFGWGLATHAEAPGSAAAARPPASWRSRPPVDRLEGIYHDLAGQTWADWLFMVGLLGIGVALLAGIATADRRRGRAHCSWSDVGRRAAPGQQPFMDDHLVYAMVLVLLAALSAGRTWGLGRAWESLGIVKRNGWLR